MNLKSYNNGKNTTLFELVLGRTLFAHIKARLQLCTPVVKNKIMAMTCYKWPDGKQVETPVNFLKIGSQAVSAEDLKPFYPLTDKTIASDFTSGEGDAVSNSSDSEAESATKKAKKSKSKKRSKNDKDMVGTRAAKQKPKGYYSKLAGGATMEDNRDKDYTL